MHPALLDKEPARLPSQRFPREAPPAPNAACCTSWDRSDTPVRPTDCHSRSAYGSAQPIPRALRLQEFAGKRTAGKLPENQKYGIGVSSPLDMVSLLEKLERGEIVTPEACHEILAILKRCQDDSGVRRRLTGVTIANKTGALDALRSEVALVYAKGGRIAMAITVDGMPKIDYTPDN